MSDLYERKYQICYMTDIFEELLKQKKEYLKKMYNSELEDLEHYRDGYKSVDTLYAKSKLANDIQAKERMIKLVESYEKCNDLELRIDFIRKEFNSLDDDCSVEKLEAACAKAERLLEVIKIDHYDDIFVSQAIDNFTSLLSKTTIQLSLTDENVNEAALDELVRLGIIKSDFERDVYSYCIQCLQYKSQTDTYLINSFFRNDTKTL